jgi:outer membrane protein assembly factor BamB/predicted MPP superfamily phosphohydrolase
MYQLSFGPFSPAQFCRRRFILATSLAVVAAAAFLPAVVSAAASSFRFAWLSDTHVGSLTGEEDLRASVRDINSLTGLSFVVISGDITEYGSLEQLRLAKGILDGLKIPCHLVPGNHDTKWSESGATDFARLWGADRFNFEFGGIRFVGMHEGPVMKMADGFWAPQDVRWLQEVLSKMPDPQQPLIFVTHYPIDDGIANWYAVLDLLKQHNVQAALCGHIHRNKADVFEGVPGIMGRSNLRNTAGAGGYNIVEAKENGTMTFAERMPGGGTKTAWHSIALKKHDFSADTKHYPRPDFAINQRFPQVKQRWRVETGYTIASSPAVAGRNAIIGDGSGTVRSLDLDSGKELWKFRTRGAIYATPEISGDLAIVPSTDGSIYGLAVGTGKPAWRFETERPIVASPQADRGMLYVGSSEGKFRALEAASGKLAWEFSDSKGFVETKPLVVDSTVIFGAWDEHLYALDARTGKLVWKWHGDKPGVLYSPAACWPVAADRKVFVVAPDRQMSAIDLASGNTVWRTADYMVRESIGISEDHNRIYARAMQDYVYAFSTADTEPKKLWQTNPGFGYDINSAMLIEKGGAVLYGTKNGVLFSLDGQTGKVNWQHRIGVGVINTVVPLSATQVLATDFGGSVVLLQAD